MGRTRHPGPRSASRRPGGRDLAAPGSHRQSAGTRGLPRQINRIAHYALSAAALDNARTVNAGHLQNALDELRP